MSNENGDLGGGNPTSGAPGVTGGSPTPTNGQPAATPPAGASPGSAQPAERTVPLAVHVEERRRYQEQIRQLQQQSARQPAPAAPPPAHDPAREEVVRNFYELFPHLRAFEKVKPEQLDGLLKLLENEPSREALTSHYWQTFGRGSLRSLTDGLKGVFGGDLDANARSYIDDAYMAWLERDPEAQRRFYENDPTLASDFIKRYDSSLFEPIRRMTLAKEQERAERRNQLPRANPRTAAVPPNGKPKTKLTDEENHNAAAAAFFGRK